MGIVDDVVNVGNSFHQGIGILAALLGVVRQEQEKRSVSVPTVIGPRSASLFEVAQLELEERYLYSVGIRQGVACIVGKCMDFAIGGPSEVPPVEALLDKHLMLLPHSLLDMPLVSVALVVLLVLLRANPLSSATAVDEGARLHMVPFGHRTCTTCRCSIHDIHKFFPCIVCMCRLRMIVVVHIRDKVVTHLLCPMSPM